LTNPQIALTPQAITLSAGFKHSLDVAGTNVTLVGRAQGLAGVSVEQEAVVLRPAFQSITLDSASLGSDVKLDAVVEVVNGALKKLLDNLNGHLSALEPKRYPLIPADPIELPDTKTGSVPVYVDAAAILIGEDGLQALAHMSLKKSDKAPPTAGTTPGSIEILYQAYRSDFESLRSRDMGAPDPSQPLWIRLSATLLRGLLAETYPPVIAWQQRAQAIGKAKKALNKLETVNAAAYVSGSCPRTWCKKRSEGHRLWQGREGHQFAIAGKLMLGFSPRSVRVSRVR